jgi:hypothetical protein
MYTNYKWYELYSRLALNETTTWLFWFTANENDLVRFCWNVDTQSEIELFWDFLLNDADDAAAISSQSTKASFPTSALCDPSFEVDKIDNFFVLRYT